MSYNDNVLAEAGPSSQTITPVEAHFVRQFRLSGGTLSPKCRFAHYETMGCGFKAAKDVEEGEALFSIPRHMLLSLKTSILPELCLAYEKNESMTQQDSSALRWEDVNVGWLGLMLTMMWEQFRSSPRGRKRFQSLLESYKDEQDETPSAPLDDEEMEESGETDEAGDPEGANESTGQHLRHGRRRKGKQDWGFYFDILPQTFDTPMFWSEEDLAELKGTSISSKIGKEEATKDYLEKVRPFILSRPDIFFGTPLEAEDKHESLLNAHYSVNHFHMMGSRILSRSFHVKDAHAGVLGEEGKEYDEQETMSNVGSDSDSDGSSEEGEGEAEDINTISMVPMADMLNARNGWDNARLFYMPDRLEMRATQKIPAGNQIFNTYGDPPSSDLLRRYGYVDLGNAADVVELGVSELIEACLVLESDFTEIRRRELLDRVAWSCSLGLEEVFPLTYPFPPSEEAPHQPLPAKPTTKELKEAAMGISEELLIQARLLCLGEEALEKAKKKERLPNARIDAVEENGSGSKKASLSVAELIHRAIEIKLNDYPTTIVEDEKMLYGSQTAANNAAAPLSTNLRNAVVVRLSEKRILRETQKVLNAALLFVSSKKREGGAQSNGQSSKRTKV